MYSKNKREKVYVIKGDVSGRTFECQCDALTECKGGEVEYKGRLVPYYRSDDGKIGWTKDKARVQEYEDKLQSEIDKVKAFIENSKGKMFVIQKDIEDDPTNFTAYMFDKVSSRKTSWKYDLINRDNDEEVHTVLEYWGDTFKYPYGADHRTMEFSSRWSDDVKPGQFIESLREITIEEYGEIAKSIVENKVDTIRTFLASLNNREKIEGE